jgi:hypothetical protein
MNTGTKKGLSSIIDGFIGGYTSGLGLRRTRSKIQEEERKAKEAEDIRAKRLQFAEESGLGAPDAEGNFGEAGTGADPEAYFDKMGNYLMSIGRNDLLAQELAVNQALTKRAHRKYLVNAIPRIRGWEIHRDQDALQWLFDNSPGGITKGWKVTSIQPDAQLVNYTDAQEKPGQMRFADIETTLMRLDTPESYSKFLELGAKHRQKLEEIELENAGKRDVARIRAGGKQGRPRTYHYYQTEDGAVGLANDGSDEIHYGLPDGKQWKGSTPKPEKEKDPWDTIKAHKIADLYWPISKEEQLDEKLFKKKSGARTRGLDHARAIYDFSRQYGGTPIGMQEALDIAKRGKFEQGYQSAEGVFDVYHLGNETIPIGPAAGAASQTPPPQEEQPSSTPSLPSASQTQVQQTPQQTPGAVMPQAQAQVPGLSDKPPIPAPTPPTPQPSPRQPTPQEQELARRMGLANVQGAAQDPKRVLSDMLAMYQQGADLTPLVGEIAKFKDNPEALKLISEALQTAGWSEKDIAGLISQASGGQGGRLLR